MEPVQLLFSLPPHMAAELTALLGPSASAWFAGSDPDGTPLGSGGGTAHLLAAAWRATGEQERFADWLRRSRKLILHGGGQSRRLPAYAPVGKPFIPLPAFRWSYGQRLDQTLVDFQIPVYQRVFERAADSYRLMVTSGDVLLRFGELPARLPEADVLAFGMTGEPEAAQHFGVFFFERDRPKETAFFLQKPPAAQIRELAQTYAYVLDTGMWLLSEKAVFALLARCGWLASEERFADGQALPFELYAKFGTALGHRPAWAAEDLNALSCAAIALPQPEFYHLGTSRQLIESVTRLQNPTDAATPSGQSGFRYHPDQFNQNTRFRAPIRQVENHTLWAENATIPASWHLAHGHVLTGIPDNDWTLDLPPNLCLDFVPIAQEEFAVRAYGLDDAFSGRMGDTETCWMGAPAERWFTVRGLSLAEAGIAPETDIQRAALFPVAAAEALSSEFLQWLFDAEPKADPESAALWRRLPRLSAHQLTQQANLTRLFAQRERNRLAALPMLHTNHQASVFFRLDLHAVARMLADSELPLPAELSDEEATRPLIQSKAQMFRAAVLRRRQQDDWRRHEAQAFAWLRRSVIESMDLTVEPVRDVLEDQIVWGRSPVRLDLAGGWTDTPPYCIEHGGRVVNLAVNLNGQPPIQVFARPTDRLELVIRSIDLGVEERIESYAQLDTYAQPGSEFALAKAAFALAGFLPRFHLGGGFASLAQQLTQFGSGIEISMLAAAPKGSGLGTSSILSSTLLATLSALCGLGWDNHALVHRTLVLEQMLTTGGGWQDQAGGLFKGIKMLESAAGVDQRLTVRWLPEHLFQDSRTSRLMLLYYTGLTRLAKDILQDIVRGMFLNRAEVLENLRGIGQNAEKAFQAIQTGNYAELCASVQASWELNKSLDAGTNPPGVQAILDRVQEDLAAAKLLGAGGGGYLLMFARDELSAERIRRRLAEDPPNPRARFVAFDISETGLQVTRS